MKMLVNRVSQGTENMDRPYVVRSITVPNKTVYKTQFVFKFDKCIKSYKITPLRYNIILSCIVFI